MIGARRAPVVLASLVALLVGVNLFLFKEVRSRGGSRPEVGPRWEVGDRAPSHRALLVFSPAQCSSHFLDELRAWNDLRTAFDGGDVAIETVAVYTSAEELSALWNSLGFELPARVDRDGELLAEMGIHALPAKIVLRRGTGVIYREEFPLLFGGEVVSKLMEGIPNAARESREGRK